MPQSAPSPTALRVADLSQTRPTGFVIRPDGATLKQIAAELELTGLRKVSFVGEINTESKADWRLTAKLGATVVQPCAITLEPVTTRIDVPVERLYVHDYEETDAPEAEMPEDDTVEPIPRWIDPADVMQEALMLALPLYPRAEGAELGELAVTEPGVAPMTDEDARPFAGLAALRDKMSNETSDDEPDKS